MMSQSAKTVVIVMQTDHEQVNDLIHSEFGAYKDYFLKVIWVGREKIRQFGQIPFCIRGRVG